MAGSPPAQTAGRTQHPLPPRQTERSPSSSQELLLKEVMLPRTRDSLCTSLDNEAGDFKPCLQFA